MNWYQTTYGEDIDGNRGIVVWEFELEPDDKEYIQQQIASNAPWLLDEEPAGGMIEIPFINPYTEQEVMVEVSLEEWL